MATAVAGLGSSFKKKGVALLRELSELAAEAGGAPLDEDDDGDEVDDEEDEEEDDRADSDKHRAERAPRWLAEGVRFPAGPFAVWRMSASSRSASASDLYGRTMNSPWSLSIGLLSFDAVAIPHSRAWATVIVCLSIKSAEVVSYPTVVSGGKWRWEMNNSVFLE